MTEPKSFFLDTRLHDYVLAHCTPPDDVQQWIIAETRQILPDVMRGSSVPPEQGVFMTILTRLVGARNAIEIGTFTGYSALSIARGLADGGRLLCCDVSEEWTAIARRAWERAGVSDRIDLRLAPAIDTLRSLPSDEVFDLAFLDADKTSHPMYYEEVLGRLRPDGVILVDNSFWFGTVLGNDTPDEETAAIRDFNDMVTADHRVESVILTIGDGLTLIRKR